MITFSGSVIFVVIWLGIMFRYSLRSLLLFSTMAAMGVSVATYYWPISEAQGPPPSQLLCMLDQRFDHVESGMDRDECFTTLGLGRYKTYFSLTARVSPYRGMGISARYTYLHQHDGFHLEIVRYQNGDQAVRLKTPSKTNWREKRIRGIDNR